MGIASFNCDMLYWVRLSTSSHRFSKVETCLFRVHHNLFSNVALLGVGESPV